MILAPLACKMQRCLLPHRAREATAAAADGDSLTSCREPSVWV